MVIKLRAEKGMLFPASPAVLMVEYQCLGGAGGFRRPMESPTDRPYRFTRENTSHDGVECRIRGAIAILPISWCLNVSCFAIHQGCGRRAGKHMLLASCVIGPAFPIRIISKKGFSPAMDLLLFPSRRSVVLGQVFQNVFG
jgi:hypothetical protein